MANKNGYFRKEGFKIEKDIPLPKLFHATISAEEISCKQVFVIGDVQGCYDELVDLLHKAQVKKDNSIIIFCGDIINKGPKSVEALRYVRQLGAYSVRGNHEERVIDAWLKWKGGKRPKKKLHWVCELSQEEIEYIMELPYTISIPSVNAVIVHGGFKPNVPLNKQQPLHMTTMRNLIPRDGRPHKASDDTIEGVAWATLWKGPQHVYYGHDARRGLQQHQFATGLDTRCMKGGELTGLFLTGEKKLIQVPAHHTYVNE